LNKIIIGDQEFFILEKPLKQLTNVYGASQYLSKLMEHRFELFSKDLLPNILFSVFVDQLSKLFPLQLGFKPLYLYYLYYLEYACTYRTYRHLYNLPVHGQRT
jgi:hypothetical protein